MVCISRSTGTKSYQPQHNGCQGLPLCYALTLELHPSHICILDPSTGFTTVLKTHFSKLATHFNCIRCFFFSMSILPISELLHVSLKITPMMYYCLQIIVGTECHESHFSIKCISICIGSCSSPIIIGFHFQLSTISVPLSCHLDLFTDMLLNLPTLSFNWSILSLPGCQDNTQGQALSPNDKHELKRASPPGDGSTPLHQFHHHTE